MLRRLRPVAIGGAMFELLDSTHEERLARRVQAFRAHTSRRSNDFRRGEMDRPPWKRARLAAAMVGLGHLVPESEIQEMRPAARKGRAAPVRSEGPSRTGRLDDLPPGSDLMRFLRSQRFASGPKSRIPFASTRAACRLGSNRSSVPTRHDEFQKVGCRRIRQQRDERDDGKNVQIEEPRDGEPPRGSAERLDTRSRRRAVTTRSGRAKA